MSRQIENDQTITRYLLGSLPGAETERLDELSVTDDEFAAALRSAEMDLIDAYVQGELSGAALDQFESYFLASPRRREKVDFARAFHSPAGREAVARAAEVEPRKSAGAESSRVGSGWLSTLGALRHRHRAWTWGVAFAGLILLVAGGWLAFENSRLRDQVSEAQARREALGRREQELESELRGRAAAGAETERELAQVREELGRLGEELKRLESQAQQRLPERRPSPKRPSPANEVSVATFVLAPQMRGVGQLPEVSVPADTDYLAMRLNLDPGEHTACRVELLDRERSRSLWRSGKLKATGAGAGKSLSVRFRAGLLRPQSVYVLRVSSAPARGEAEVVGEYSFRVARQ